MDNLRLTNCEPGADPDGIGVTEELVCGMLPIVEWLRDRGISVSGEGYNGLPIDPTMLNAAFWHHDASDRSRQIFHRKVMGGGRGDHYGGATTMDFGICKSIHQDITYRPVSVSSLGKETFLQYFPVAARADAGDPVVPGQLGRDRRSDLPGIAAQPVLPGAGDAVVGRSRATA